MPDLIVRNGNLIDGTGAPARDADLVIDGGEIVLVGDASAIEGARTIDARGRTVCPGFIDIHSHSDFPLYVDGLAQSGVRQGLTTLVTGNCGHGPAPAPDRELAKQVTIGVNDEWGVDFAWNTFEEYLDSLFSRGQSMNVAPLVAHGPVRLAAMGFDARQPTAAELDDMRAMVAEAMSAGAVGFSTGLEYSPGRHANEDELTALSRGLSPLRRHLRKPHPRAGRQLRGRGRGGVEHRAAGGPAGPASPPGAQAVRARGRLRPGARHAESEAREREGLRVGIDTFPDPWGPAHLLDLAPPWVYEGAEDEVLARLRDPETAERCRAHFETPTNFLLRLGGFDKFFLSTSNAHPELVGRSLENISREWELGPARTVFELAAADGADYSNVLIRHIFARQQDLDQAAARPVLQRRERRRRGIQNGRAQVVGRQPVQLRVRPAVHTGVRPRPRPVHRRGGRAEDDVPARRLGAATRGRGRLQPGNAADFVVIDLDAITDNSTDDRPQAYPSGIDVVAVNGQIVVDNGSHTGATPGELASSPEGHRRTWECAVHAPNSVKNTGLFGYGANPASSLDPLLSDH